MGTRHAWNESCAWAVATRRAWQHRRCQETRAPEHQLVYNLRQNCEGFDSLEFTDATSHLRGKRSCGNKVDLGSAEEREFLEEAGSWS